MTKDTALECFQRGVAWIAARLDSFLPVDRMQSQDMKEITELAMFYGYTVVWLDEQRRAALYKIRDFVIDFLSNPVLPQWVRKHPGSYNPYMLAYLPLRGTGVRLHEFEEALTATRRAGFPQAIETIPYREMEFQHALWKAGLSPRRPSWGGDCFRRTTLGRVRNPIYCSLADVYSITHTLFYLMDFAGPRTDIPGRERDCVIDIIEPMLVYFWRQSNWDVAAELLLNLVSLDRADTALFNAAFNALTGAWRSDGSLPGPHFHESEMSDDEKLIFRHCYHTTIVGTMLCIVLHFRSGGK